jgi:hypothetical protein
LCQAQDDCGKWRQIPAFGDWNHLWDDMPVAQYFDPAATFFFTAQAGEDDVDLFKVPHFAANPYTYKKVSDSVPATKPQSRSIDPRSTFTRSGTVVFLQQRLTDGLFCVCSTENAVRCSSEEGRGEDEGGW